MSPADNKLPLSPKLSGGEAREAASAEGSGSGGGFHGHNRLQHVGIC